MKKDALRFLVIVLGLAEVVMLAHWIDDHRQQMNAPISEERLYVDGATAKRLTFAFNGIAADWYWMRSLQYVGQKIVNYEDSHDGRFNLGNLSSLDLNLLAPLLRVTTTLDPQFMAPYEFGAVILPELNQNEAISLLNYGIAANPSSWRLHHYLGYICWQRKDYAQASDVYAAGAKLPGAPAWMAALSARMKAEGGSRDAAREMYLHLYDSSSSDNSVKQMVEKQLMRLDSLDERDMIRRTLDAYKARNGRCVSSWREVSDALPASIDMGGLNGTPVDRLRVSRQMKFDSVTGAPLDPSDTPYRLIKDGCDVDLSEDSKVPRG
jgi:tetratricopeptide (TPR) repeat protein